MSNFVTPAKTRDMPAEGRIKARGKIRADFADGQIIFTCQNDTDTLEERIPISDIETEAFYTSTLAPNESDKSKRLLLLAQLDDEVNKVIAARPDANRQSKYAAFAYTDGTSVKYALCTAEQAYKRLISFKHRIISFKIGQQIIKLKSVAYVLNPYDIDIQSTTMYMDSEFPIDCKLNIYRKSPGKKAYLQNVHTFSMPTQTFINDDSPINNTQLMVIRAAGYDIVYSFGNPFKKPDDVKKTYLPIKVLRTGEFYVFARRNPFGSLILVKRKAYDYENTSTYKFWESKFMSALLYGSAGLVKKLRSKPVSIFYEKLAATAEEGAFELFEMCRDKGRGKSYYIMDENANDYPKIKDKKNVVKKFSPLYYWLCYSADNAIATETPVGGANLLRPVNGILRRALQKKYFVFLQHGITYMKCQDRNAPFAMNREAEADMMVVSSEKEKKVCNEGLGLPEDRLIVAGLTGLGPIPYNHINQDSDDTATIMLTWKPYEEQLYDFRESDYYKEANRIYDLLCQYLKPENVHMVAHPKVTGLMRDSGLGDRLWTGSIRTMVENTKLIITDYSSICYNSFYRGAGVIFYQPDLDYYEYHNGPLIPSDDEYIGHRAFDLDQLKSILDDSITDSTIHLDKLRTEEFKRNHLTINQFNDGRNVDRIFEELMKRKLV